MEHFCNLNQNQTSGNMSVMPERSNNDIRLEYKNKYTNKITDLMETCRHQSKLKWKNTSRTLNFSVCN